MYINQIGGCAQKFPRASSVRDLISKIRSRSGAEIGGLSGFMVRDGATHAAFIHSLQLDTW